MGESLKNHLKLIWFLTRKFPNVKGLLQITSKTGMITGKTIRSAKRTAYVHDVLLFEARAATRHTLPFFADGYPGIVFCEAPGAYTWNRGIKSYPRLYS